MKRATITFKDEDMLQGAKDAAQEQGISFSEYATSLIGLDLQLRLQYKIIAFYDDGSTNEETGFYTGTKSVSVQMPLMTESVVRRPW